MHLYHFIIHHQNLSICKLQHQRCPERYVLFIFMVHLYLIISWEAIHERHPLRTACIINHNIHDREREFVFRATNIQIMVVDANPDLSILFGNENDISHLIRMLFLPDKSKVYELLDFWFDRFLDLGTESSLLLFDGLPSGLMLRWYIAIWKSSSACPYNSKQRHLYILV